MSKKNSIARIIFRIFVGAIALAILISIISSWSKADKIPYEIVILFVLFFSYAIGGNELAGNFLNLLGINLNRQINTENDSDDSSHCSDKLKSEKISAHSQPFPLKLTLICFFIMALLMCL